MAQKSLRTPRLRLETALTEQEAANDHAERLSAGTFVPGLGVWSRFAADGGDFVGWWALSPVVGHGGGAALHPTVADLGYQLLPRFWRQGLAREGAREVLTNISNSLKAAA
ncbi:hypothetical protein ACQRIU_005954 [Beauveria bassiana]